jgi:hypothetical protein
MASWRKLLSQMANDPDPRNYTFEDAARVLERSGFVQAPSGGTSHRRFRLAVQDGGEKRTVIVGLVDRGHGTLKPVYIRELVRVLREEGLIPDDEPSKGDEYE